MSDPHVSEWPLSSATLLDLAPELQVLGQACIVTKQIADCKNLLTDKDEL